MVGRAFVITCCVALAAAATCAGATITTRGGSLTHHKIRVQPDAGLAKAVLGTGPQKWTDDGVRREAEDEPGCPYADSVMDEYHPDYNPDGVITLAYAENLLLWDLIKPRLSAETLAAAHTRYEYSYGSVPLRRSFARHMDRGLGGSGLRVDPDNLVMVSGAVTALGLALDPIFDLAVDRAASGADARPTNSSAGAGYRHPRPVAGAIIPAPYYHAYDKLMEHAGGVIVPARFDMGTCIGVKAPAPCDSAGAPSCSESWQLPRSPTVQPPCTSGSAAALMAALEDALMSARRGDFDPDEFTHVTPAVVVLTNPHNPLGQPFTQEQLEAAFAFAARHGLHVIADEIFSNHVFGPGARFVSAAVARLVHEASSRPGAAVLPATHLHVVTGMGKLGLSGFKIGALWTTSPLVLPAARRAASFAQISSGTQAAVAAMLSDSEFMSLLLAANLKRLAAAYAAVVAALRAEGIPFVATPAGVSVLVDLRAALPATGDLWAAERDLRSRVQEQARVFIAAASSFHSPAPGFFRLAFADNSEAVSLGVRRLGLFLRLHHPEVLAADVTRRLRVAWARSDAIFSMLAVNDAAGGEPGDAELRQRPIQLRHPFIFYLGHLPGFAWLQMQATLPAEDAPAFNAAFDHLFERGIDPDVETGDCHSHSADIDMDEDAWPSATDVRAYRDEVRARIIASVDTTLRRAARAAAGASPEDAGLRGTKGQVMATGGRVFELIVEHEVMHSETLLYMLQQYDHAKKKQPDGTDPNLDSFVLSRHSAQQKGPATVSVGGGTTALGVDVSGTRWGWDNEMPRVEVNVAPFDIDRRPVTNLDYLAFVSDGAYANPDLWAPSDWQWIQRDNVTGSLFWHHAPATGTTTLRRMFTDVPMFQDSSVVEGGQGAASSPVTVSHAEASAYCRWAGGSLPSEAQWVRAAAGSSAAGGVPGVHGSWDFWAWGTSPAGSFPAGDSAWGVSDMYGNGWEWTSTEFDGHLGFEANIPTYPGYSADFFDGKHYVLLGGSWATDRALTRRSFRNFYQAHYPYVFSQFRCVYEPAPAATPSAAFPKDVQQDPIHQLPNVGDVVSLVSLGATSLPPATDLLARNVLVGLTATPKHIPSMFLYDDIGSDLFAAITDLPEYYPTRTEASILQRHKEAIAAVAAAATREDARAALEALDAGKSVPTTGPSTIGFNTVELGAGDGRKTLTLLRHFVATSRRCAYTSIDISEGALHSQAARLRASGLDLSPTSPLYKVTLIAGDNVEGVRALTQEAKAAAAQAKLEQVEHDRERRLVMYLGSSIGNFDDEAIAGMLADLWLAMDNDDLLMVGFDLRKMPDVVTLAYNDTQRVTAEFNRNLLSRINKELQADFNPEKFTFHCWYDSFTGAVQSTLVSTEPQTVHVGFLGRSFDFDAWEAVHTEVSRKFTLAEIESYATRGGFEVVRHFSDANGWFVDTMLRVVKD